ncbi:MAG: hypothetical protein HY399_00780, partial [Elusimicrobia bacterium]|nr:hypothetical protein [Elusimicrobiota bacterium]
KEFAPAWVVWPLLAYFAVSLSSKVQIGYRHILPIFPFFIILAGLFAGWLFSQKGYAKVFVLFLAAWQLGSVCSVGPHYLSYFNESIGGSRRGYRYLVDSNLDWGQALQSLAQELRSWGNPPIYFSYFGSADPAAYGVKYVPLLPVSNVEDRKVQRVFPARSSRLLLAVSATNLQAAYWSDKAVWEWLKRRKPVKQIGYAIFLYDLTGDRDGLKSLAALFSRSGNPGEAREILVFLDRKK